MAYSEKLMQHFHYPRNQGQLPDADGIGEVGNPVCGDMMKIYIKVDKKNASQPENQVISDIKFETLGCGAAIACSSILTELAKNQTIESALNISRQKIADELGGVPSIKMHCSVLASDGLKMAIKNYFEKIGVLDNFSQLKSFQAAEHSH